MSDKEAAQEEATYRHGVFTYHLLDLLTRSPGGPLSLAAIYGAVGDAVRTATNGAPEPEPPKHARKPSPLPASSACRRPGDRAARGVQRAV